MTYISVIIAAAGIGSRMQENIPKQYLKIKNKTILERTLLCFKDIDIINEIILVVPKKDIDFCSEKIVKNLNFKKKNKTDRRRRYKAAFCF